MRALHRAIWMPARCGRWERAMEELRAGLTAAYAGKSAEEIEAELEASAAASEIRDPVAVARYLHALAAGMI